MIQSEISLPAEWAPQRLVWVGWPRLETEWGEAFSSARREIAQFASALARHVPVRVAIGDDQAEADAVAAGLGRVAELSRVPTGDIWLRDTGPIFHWSPDGSLAAACFDFNGWGGAFNLPGDRATADAIACKEDAVASHNPFILEAGGIEHDGEGTFIATRECLLNVNRNGWSEAEAENALEKALGARRIVWLPRGLAGDHTDGHVDNIARFIAPGRVVCQIASHARDPQSERLLESEASLMEAGLEVVTIPSPGRVEDGHGRPLPASHLNFVFANGAVLMPDFGTPQALVAAQVLERAALGMSVELLPARSIVQGGGAFHCMTCHVPARPRAGLVDAIR